MKKFNPIFLLVLWAVFNARASGTIDTSFRIFRTADAPAQLQVVRGRETLLLDVPEGTRSTLLRYKGPRDFALWEPVDGGRSYQVSLPDGSPLRLLVLDTPTDGEVLVLNDDLETHALGVFRLVNAAAEDLEITFGEEQRVVSPGSEVFFPHPDRPTAFVQIKSGSDGPILLSNNWSLPANTRSLMLITPGGEGKPRLHRITEGAPPTR